ncbi:MAG: MarC family protein [Lentisphaerae bacterium]|nr:MarC family protein [Lentisphaerota bacterium]
MKDFWLCFVPLFVAVDAFGVLPLFIGLTQDLDRAAVPRVLRQSVITAGAVALLFLAVGSAVLRLLGITIADFMIAGGTLLFVVSMSDMLSAEKSRRQVDPDSLGAVPIGVPLITGPAVLTTSILLLNQHGVAPTAAALIVNILIAGVVFHHAERLHAFLGKAGSKAISKVAGLLLAAIGVMIVRRGLTAILSP